jgi:hypothetical protein
VVDIPGIETEIVLDNAEFRRELANSVKDMKGLERALKRAGVQLDNVEREAKQAGVSFGGLRGALGAVVAGFGALQLAKTGFDLARVAASAQDTQAAFARAGFVLDDFRGATDGLVSDRALAQQFNLARQAGISQEAFLELTKVARTAGRVLGRDVAESVERLTLGIAKQEKEVLDELGIVFSATQVYEQYAANIGKSAQSLSDLEKRQAFTNEVLRQGRTLVANNTSTVESASEAFARFDAAIANISDAIGKRLIPLVQTVTPLLSDLAEALTIGEQRESDAFDTSSLSIRQEVLSRIRRENDQAFAEGLISREAFEAEKRRIRGLQQELIDELNALGIGGGDVRGPRLRIELEAVDLSGFTRSVRKALEGPSKDIQRLNKQFRDFRAGLQAREFQGLFQGEGSAQAIAGLVNEREATQRRFGRVIGPRRTQELDERFSNLAAQALAASRSIEDFQNGLRVATDFGLAEGFDPEAIRQTVLENIDTAFAGLDADVAQRITEGGDISDTEFGFRALADSGINLNDILQQSIDANREAATSAADFEDAVADASDGVREAFGQDIFNVIGSGILERFAPGLDDDFARNVSEDVGGAFEGVINANGGQFVSRFSTSVGKLIGGAFGSSLGATIGGAAGPVVGSALASVLSGAVEGLLQGVSSAVGAVTAGFGDQRFNQAGAFAAAVATTAVALTVLGTVAVGLTAGLAIIPIAISQAFAPFLIFGGFALIFAQQTENFRRTQQAFTKAFDPFIEAFDSIAFQLIGLAPVIALVGEAFGILLAGFGADLPNILFTAFKLVGLSALGLVIVL